MPQYLKRDGSYFKLQKRIPTDIMQSVSPEDRKAVLGTVSAVFKKHMGSDLRDAKRRLPAELATLEALFSQLRGDVRIATVLDVTQEHLEAVAWAEFQEAKAMFKEFLDQQTSVNPRGISFLIEPPTEKWVDGLRDGYWSEAANVAVEGALFMRGIALSRTSLQFAEARRMIAVAVVDGYQAAASEFQGGYNYAPHIPERKAAEIGVTINGQSPTITMIHQRWGAERKPNPRTALEWDAAISMFVEVVGDKPVASISKADCRAFKDALMQAPVSFRKRFPGKALPEVVELTARDVSLVRLSSGSVGKYLRAVSSVLSWAEANGYIDGNPMPKITLDGSADGKTRISFTVDDLTKLFGHPVFTNGERPKGGGGEAAKYLPLLGLFTGARLEELGQALTSDIRQEGGIWYLDINHLDEGKSLKTRSSRRKVPLHPELLACGFLDYVQGLIASGVDRLFPELRRNASGKVTANWSKWFNRLKKEAGISIPAKAMKDFHSFRHGFKDACRAAQISEEVSDALTGHVGGGVGRRYGSDGVPLAVKVEAIKRVRYDQLSLIPPDL